MKNFSKYNELYVRITAEMFEIEIELVPNAEQKERYIELFEELDEIYNLLKSEVENDG